MHSHCKKTEYSSTYLLSLKSNTWFEVVWRKAFYFLEIGFVLRYFASTVLHTYYCCFQPFLYLLVQSNTQITFAYLSFFQLCRIRLEAMSGDRVELKCSLYNVHHEIDMDRFSVEWIASKYQQSSKKSGSTTSSGTCCTTNTDCHEFVQFSESNAFDRCRQIEQVGISIYFAQNHKSR